MSSLVDSVISAVLTEAVSNEHVARQIHGAKHDEMVRRGYRLYDARPGSDSRHPSAFYTSPRHNPETHSVQVNGYAGNDLRYLVVKGAHTDNRQLQSAHYTLDDLENGVTKDHARAHRTLATRGWEAAHAEQGGKSTSYAHAEYPGHTLAMSREPDGPRFEHRHVGGFSKRLKTDSAKEAHDYFDSGEAVKAVASSERHDAPRSERAEPEEKRSALRLAAGE